MAHVRVVNAVTGAVHSVRVPMRIKVCGLCPKDEIVVVGPTGVLAEYAPKAVGCAHFDPPEFDSQTVYVGAMAYLFARGLIEPKDVAKCGGPTQYGYQARAAAIIGAHVGYALSFYAGCPPGACSGAPTAAQVYGFRPTTIVILKVVRIDYWTYEGGTCVQRTEWPTNTWDWVFLHNVPGFKDYLIPRISQGTICIRREGKIVACTNAPIWNGTVTYYVA